MFHKRCGEINDFDEFVDLKEAQEDCNNDSDCAGVQIWEGDYLITGPIDFARRGYLAKCIKCTWDENCDFEDSRNAIVFKKKGMFFARIYKYVYFCSRII